MPLRRDGSFKPQRQDVNCILLSGGVGDHVGTLVAVNYILETYPWINLLIWVPDFLLEFAKNVLPKKAIVRDFTAMRTKYDRNKITIHTEWDGRVSPMKIHSLDYAFFKLCDETVPIEKKNYLKVKFDRVDIKHYNLPKDYVALATGFTAGVREFSPEAINGVVDYILSKSQVPVFLGQEKTPTGITHVIQGNFSKDVDYSKGINLINKTTLVQSAKVMQGAKAMVGVDCGLLHIAGCTDVPIVGGFTTVTPDTRMPVRNNQLGYNYYPIVPEESLDCRFCQEKTNFLYGHDYTKCIYGDYLCVKGMTADKFIEQLKKILEGK